MHEKLKEIFERRSVRKYETKSVSDEIVRDMLEAGMSAPSAVAKDPWEFIVVRDKAILDRIAGALPNGKMLKEAAIGILVCGDISKAHDNAESYMLQDCSAAIENILLAASMMGLGGVWLGVHPREERILFMKTLFELPENIMPVSMLSIGWPSEKPAARSRYDEVKVHRDKW